MNDAHLQTVEDFYQSQNLSSWCRFKDKQKLRGEKKNIFSFSFSKLFLLSFYLSIFCQPRKFWQFMHV